MHRAEIPDTVIVDRFRCHCCHLAYAEVGPSHCYAGASALYNINSLDAQAVVRLLQNCPPPYLDNVVIIPY